MKKSNPLSAISRLAILTAAIIAPSLASAAGTVTDGFARAADREYVEVNLDRNLIELALGIVASKEPALAATFEDIDRVSVRVIGLDESNRSASLVRVGEIRTTLESDGWTSIVSVNEGHGGDNVSILARVVDDAITGLVITVIDAEDEVVVVDISGRVKTEQIAALIDRLNIEGLGDLSNLLEEV